MCALSCSFFFRGTWVILVDCKMTGHSYLITTVFFLAIVIEPRKSNSRGDLWGKGSKAGFGFSIGSLRIDNFPLLFTVP